MLVPSIIASTFLHILQARTDPMNASKLMVALVLAAAEDECDIGIGVIIGQNRAASKYFQGLRRSLFLRKSSF